MSLPRKWTPFAGIPATAPLLALWLVVAALLPVGVAEAAEGLYSAEEGPNWRIEPFGGLFTFKDTATTAVGTEHEHADVYPAVGINVAAGGTLWDPSRDQPLMRLGLELELGYLYSWNTEESPVRESTEMHQLQAMAGAQVWLAEVFSISALSGYRFLQTTFERSLVPDSVHVEHVPMFGLGLALEPTLTDGLRVRLEGRWLVDARGTLDLFSGSLRFIAGSLILGVLADAIPRREFTQDNVTFRTRFAATVVFTLGVRG